MRDYHQAELTSVMSQT